MRSIFFIYFFFIIINLLHAQMASDNWVPVSIEEDIYLFVNVSGLSSFTGDEIFVWSLQEMDPPMTMEEVNGDIYKVRTYYHINREINRYSIKQIIFYDEKDNVLKQYSYDHKSDKPEFKFNYPIIRNSEVDKILLKCMEYVGPSIEKK